MTYNNIINSLFLQFPFLEKKYLDEGNYIKGLPHLCYSIVFVPFIRQTVFKNDKKMLITICNFMECMANSGDELVSELLAVSVLESIISERDLIKKLKQYMGLKTNQLLLILEEAYGWES